MCISQESRGVHIFIIPFLAFILTSQNAMHMLASTSLKTQSFVTLPCDHKLRLTLKLVFMILLIYANN